MSLTQHLIDKGLIRYQAGAWTLPRRIEPDDLPGSLGEALKPSFINSVTPLERSLKHSR